MSGEHVGYDYSHETLLLLRPARFQSIAECFLRSITTMVSCVCQYLAFGRVYQQPFDALDMRSCSSNVQNILSKVIEFCLLH